MKTRIRPIKKNMQIKLSPEEKRMDAEQGWRELDPSSNEYQSAITAVTSTAQSLKAARFTARISNDDLEMLKKRAAAEGLGYQTLLGSLVHKYVTGQLVDLVSARLALETMRKRLG